MQTYIVALPVILTALMSYIVWLLQKQRKLITLDDAPEKLREAISALVEVEA